ncbi:MAG: hypothetical protein ACFFCS_19350 [Candidatus Hodarchaeota archaeon]
MKTRKIIFGLLAGAIFIILVILFAFWMFNLHGIDTFIIDTQNPEEQKEGIAYTLTLILVLFYLISGAYLVMEGKASEIEVQKKFYYGLAILFLFISLAQGVIVLYSILDKPPYEFASTIMPNLTPLNRSDTVFALAFATFSSPVIMHRIEKYIRASKKYVITKLLLIGTCAGIFGIIACYVQGVYPSLENEDWWEYTNYAMLGLTGMNLIITLIALPTMYGTLARQTSGDLKKNAQIISFGYIFTFLMVILHLIRTMVFQDVPYSWMIFLIGNIIGSFILLIGYLKSTF